MRNKFKVSYPGALIILLSLLTTFVIVFFNPEWYIGFMILAGFFQIPFIAGTISVFLYVAFKRSLSPAG